MFEQIRARLPGPQFLLCVLPERKNSNIYGPWKKKNLHEMGIVTPCLAPTKINDQYLTNLLLKINSKLGGTNSLLAIEHSPCIPLINQTPTMILGMDVSHGSPGQSNIPSIAAVVGSRAWPLISRYRASVRTQSPKVEMIDSLFKPLANGQDDGIIRELLLDFYQTSNHRKPLQIVIFRFKHLVRLLSRMHMIRVAWPFGQAVFMNCCSKLMEQTQMCVGAIRKSGGPWKVGTTVMTMMKLSISYGRHWRGLTIWTGRVYVLARN